MDKFEEKILFQMFAAHSTMYALPTIKSLNEYLERMLTIIPGVERVDVCILDLTKRPSSEINSRFFGRLSSKNDQFSMKDFLRFRKDFGENFYIYPLMSDSYFYGFIAIEASDNAKFSYFDPVISNFSISISIILENKFQRYSLETLNKALEKHKQDLESKVSERTMDLEIAQKKLESMFIQIIHAFSITVELRDPYTAGHQYRVAMLSKAIAQSMSLPERDVQEVYFGALIHDIGKVQVPQEILAYPGRLSKLQMDFIKIHPKAGSKIIQRIDFSDIIYNIVLHHHERLDGSGYPEGLKAEDIAMTTRIVSVADVFEAMISHRPYRPKNSLQATLQELKNGSGKIYDKNAVECCIDLIVNEKFIMPVYDYHGFDIETERDQRL